MGPLVATVHNPLVPSWSCYRSNGAINETPTLIQRSTFGMYGSGESFQIQPDQIQ